MENKMPFLGKINCRDFWKIDYHLHNYGNKYNVAMTTFNYDNTKEEYDAYYLAGQYSTLHFTVACRSNSYHANDVSEGAYIQIIGDGKVLYEAYGINTETLPYEAEVNVSGIQKMKVVMSGYDTGAFSMIQGSNLGIYPLLCDPYLIEASTT